MKCPRCYALNSASDAACVSCGTQLESLRLAAAKAAIETPQWAYFFVALCGIIPVVTLGGMVPVLLGVGGAGGCLKVARASSIPLVLRLLACFVITAACWLLLAMVLVALFGNVKRR